MLDEHDFDLILSGRRLPKVSGMDLLKRVQIKHPNSKMVLISEDASAQAAVEAIRAGACDYLTLPVSESDLNRCLDRTMDLADVSDEPKASPGGSGMYTDIIGQSPAIKEVFRLIDKLACTDSTIMISGESGTGKELVARAIHQNGHRKNNPLIPVNCGAIPEELLESELFGHEKGAFTSAIRSRAGRFEMADQGTIFLDEVAEMSPKLQVKLLRGAPGKTGRTNRRHPDPEHRHPHHHRDQPGPP